MIKKSGLVFTILLSAMQVFIFSAENFAQSQSPELEESIRPTKGKVLEEFTYSITYDENLELILPEKGDLIPEGMDLPIAEILSIKTKPISTAGSTNQLQTIIIIRFFKEGNYLSPIQWKKNDSEEIVESKRSFVVEANVSPEEIEPADIRPPWGFGDFLFYRLFIVIIIIAIVISIAFFFFRKYKERIMDAIIEAPFEPPAEEWVEKKFRDLFANKKIPQKEFAYLLTEYLKLQSSKKFNLNFDPLTDQELLYKIYQSSTITKEKVEDTKYFFLYSKYKPNSEDLDWEEAKEILDEWKKRLS